MRLAIFSDVHSNLPALEAALADAAGVDDRYCPGDLVGYAPWPNETLELQQREDVPTLVPASVGIKLLREASTILARIST